MRRSPGPHGGRYRYRGRSIASPLQRKQLCHSKTYPRERNHPATRHTYLLPMQYIATWTKKKCLPNDYTSAPPPLSPQTHPSATYFPLPLIRQPALREDPTPGGDGRRMRNRPLAGRDLGKSAARQLHSNRTEVRSDTISVNNPRPASTLTWRSIAQAEVCEGESAFPSFVLFLLYFYFVFLSI